MIDENGASRPRERRGPTSFEIYLDDIGSRPLLTPAEEHHVARELFEARCAWQRYLAGIPLAVERLCTNGRLLKDGARQAETAFYLGGTSPAAIVKRFTAIARTIGRIRKLDQTLQDRRFGRRRKQLVRQEIAGQRERLAKAMGEIPFKVKVLEETTAELRRAAEAMEELRASTQRGARRQLRELARTIGVPFRDLRRTSAAIQAAADAYRAAARELTERNLRLVVFTAKRHRGPEPILDTFQNGSFGLMRAVELFDYRRGRRFSTYATWWIRQAILRERIDCERLIRFPASFAEAEVRRYLRTAEQLAHSLGRRPYEEEVAKAAGLSLENARLIRDSLPLPVSLDQPIGDGPDARGDFVAAKVPMPDEMFAGEERRRLIEMRVGTLRPQHREILRRRFGLNGAEGEETLEAIGNDLGKSRERVRQVQGKGLKQLRRYRELRQLL